MSINYSEGNPDFEKEVTKHLMGEKPKKDATKRCPHCHAEILTHLLICPNCRKRVMWYDLLGSLGWKLILLGLLMGLILFGLIMLGLLK